MTRATTLSKLCKKCKTASDAPDRCPLCGAKMGTGKTAIQLLAAATFMIVALGVVYLFLSFSGRFEGDADYGAEQLSPGIGIEEPDGQDHALLTAGEYDSEGEYEQEAEADPMDVLIAELAEAAGTAQSLAESGAFITNRGFLYDLSTESFVLAGVPLYHGGESPMLLFLNPRDIDPYEGEFSDGFLFGAGLRVLAAVIEGERVIMADAYGRRGSMYVDVFRRLLERYENVHGEIYFPEFDDPMTQELLQLVSSYIFSSYEIEINWLSKDDRYIFAIMTEISDYESIERMFIFRAAETGFEIAAADFDGADDIRAAVNALLPDFNLDLLTFDNLYE